MDIRIIKTVHIRGVPRHEGDVVDVTSAEARQYISSGHAEELNYEKERYILLKTNLQITTAFPEYLRKLLPKETKPVVAKKYEPKHE